MMILRSHLLRYVVLAAPFACAIAHPGLAAQKPQKLSAETAQQFAEEEISAALARVIDDRIPEDEPVAGEPTQTDPKPSKQKWKEFEPAWKYQIPQTIILGGSAGAASPRDGKTDVSSKAISVPKGAGTIQGLGESFSAQPSTGISTFSVPITLPKARGAVQPSLMLSYSSSGGKNTVGLGWSLSDTFIARQTDRGIPKYDDRPAWHPEQDRFVFSGGQELIPICDAPCTGKLLGDEKLPDWAGPGWQYFRPRIEGSWLRFFWNSSQQTWRVQDKAGNLLELGVVAKERDGIEPDPDSPTRVYRWNLKRQTDPHGNEVRYFYEHDGAIAYLTDIHDTFPASKGSEVPVAEWAHHVRLVYETRPDPSTLFNRGWMTTIARRLARVDVMAKGTAGTDETIRSYTLGYARELHASMLESIAVRGRCDASGCTSLPLMRFEYSHVKPTFDSGFEALDTTVRDITSSPTHSVDDSTGEFYDVNSDGLPDVVAMDPGRSEGKHGLWLNGWKGKAGWFSKEFPMGVRGISGESGNVVRKANPNVAGLDVDGDATIDLLHMPRVKKYGVYSPKFLGNEWTWVGRAVTTADQLDARIDFGTDTGNVRVVDLNGDGLVDVLRSTGSAYQVWFGLGRFPSGDGQFGSGRWTSASEARLSMSPVLHCVPWSGRPVMLSDAEVRLADMNGDGLVDLVRLERGDIRYWPGRGDGSFGTRRVDCSQIPYSDKSFIQMSSSPHYQNPNREWMYLEDVNGDGLSDLIQVNIGVITLWLNLDGTSWATKRFIDVPPPMIATVDPLTRVRLTDINGSGTTDIVWAESYHYRYLDLAGGNRPGLLTRVFNGLGKTTEIEYTTSTEQMLEAERDEMPWAKKAPFPLHVVARVTVRDNLGELGRQEGIYVTEYRYRDPVYDGVQREFRGFSDTEVRTIGGTNSPTSWTKTSFHLGERVKGFLCDGVDYANVKNRWMDNPREALKGLPRLVETYGLDREGNTLVHSTQHHAYRLSRMYQGLDARSVFVALEQQNDTWLYDTSTFIPGDTHQAVQSVAVDCERAPDVDETLLQPPAATGYESSDVTIRASRGTKHLKTQAIQDPWGNRIRAIDFGADGDKPIHAVSKAALVSELPLGTGYWAWRTTESWVSGNDQRVRRNHSQIAYDGYGNPTQTQARLEGVVALERGSKKKYPDGSEIEPAPAPSSASSEGWITSAKLFYDAYGNTVFEVGAGDRCRSITYDKEFAQLPANETVYAGQPVPMDADDMLGTGVSGSFSCGSIPLTAHAIYDAALQLPTDILDLHLEKTTIRYDGLGRLVALERPRSDLPALSTLTLKVEYALPDQTGKPYSRITTYTQDGKSEGDPEFLVSHSFVDALGRALVSVSEGDKAVDGFAWVVQGISEYDEKGALWKKYLASGYDGSPESILDAPLAAAPFATQSYDAFGRVVETHGLDGRLTLRTVYHALSIDAWDAEDDAPGVHHGTYATQETDGHSRVKRTIERVKSGNSLEEHFIDMTYLPSGEPYSITRRQGSEAFSRTMVYDSLGKLVLNNEPSTSGGGKAWRYAYDDAGNLVGTSDARGCGVNYKYEAAGRLMSEDYSPCEPHHAKYSADPEVSYRYDEADEDALVAFPGQGQAYTMGRLVSVTDRASKLLTQYDGRGRAVRVAKKIASPAGSQDTDQWFITQAAFDGADRPVKQTTGATVNGGQDAAVLTVYSNRGLVRSVETTHSSSPLVRLVKHDPDGLVTHIQYGDKASTTTSLEYDELRWLKHQITYRAKPEAWPSEPTSDERSSQQLLLQDEEFQYDLVGNPKRITDWRTPTEWPAGAKPVSRAMHYDDLYRLARIEYEYSAGDDVWVDPYRAESEDVRRPQPSPRGDFASAGRVLSQDFGYDWLGNTIATDDNSHAFYDRSLGKIQNEGYQIQRAENASLGGGRTGKLSTAYDLAGYLSSLTVERNGPCIPAGDSCKYQHFEYLWDEVGRLIRARRWDASNWDAVPPAAELQYAYDASDSRVRKTAGDRHTVYVFNTLELRLAQYDVAKREYEVSDRTEVPYLFANGVGAYPPWTPLCCIAKPNLCGIAPFQQGGEQFESIG